MLVLGGEVFRRRVPSADVKVVVKDSPPEDSPASSNPPSPSIARRGSGGLSPAIARRGSGGPSPASLRPSVTNFASNSSLNSLASSNEPALRLTVEVETPTEYHNLGTVANRLEDERLGLTLRCASSEASPTTVIDTFKVTSPLPVGSTPEQATEALQAQLQLLGATRMRAGELPTSPSPSAPSDTKHARLSPADRPKALVGRPPQSPRRPTVQRPLSDVRRRAGAHRR